MKIVGLKYRLLLVFISILFLAVDIFLMLSYGFEGQLLIFLYVAIGSVSLCGIIDLLSNMSVPTITINYESQNIISKYIGNELYKSDRRLRNQYDIFYFDEIIHCEIDSRKLLIKLRYGHIKTLHLIFFTKRQIEKIKKEIDNIICTRTC